MPPKNRFSKEEVVRAALALVKEGGIEALTARRLAERLASSTKPIFVYFPSMEDLFFAVLVSADEIYQGYLGEAISSGKYPAYKASGMGYIRFASEEPQLFRLLFMRDRQKEQIPENREDIRPILDIIQKNLSLTEEEAFLFHMEMWIFVHGIAVMRATHYLEWDEAFISAALTDMYQGLKSRFEKRENKNGY